MSKKQPSSNDPEVPSALPDARAQTKARAIRILTEANPSPMHAAAVRIYADAFTEYIDAQRNIDAHGTIVFHPRTGAPIENPYTKARDAASAKMLRIRLRVDRLWTELGAAS